MSQVATIDYSLQQHVWGWVLMSVVLLSVFE